MRPLIALALLLTASAQAQTLRLGYRTEPTSLDPHYHNATPSSQIALHVFDALTAQSTASLAILEPRLALSWTATSETTWEFKLRPNIRFAPLVLRPSTRISTVCPTKRLLWAKAAALTMARAAWLRASFTASGNWSGMVAAGAWKGSRP